MKKLLGTMLLLLAPLTACGDDETSTTTGGDKDVSDVLALLPNGNVMDGEQVYGDSCAQTTCHGADGNTGASASPPLSEAVPQRTDEELAVVIRFGTINEGGVMPEQTQLEAQDIADVIAFLRQEFPE